MWLSLKCVSNPNKVSESSHDTWRNLHIRGFSFKALLNFHRCWSGKKLPWNMYAQKGINQGMYVVKNSYFVSYGFCKADSQPLLSYIVIFLTYLLLLACEKALLSKFWILLPVTHLVTATLPPSITVLQYRVLIDFKHLIMVCLNTAFYKHSGSSHCWNKYNTASLKLCTNNRLVSAILFQQH